MHIAKILKGRIEEKERLNFREGKYIFIIAGI